MAPTRRGGPLTKPVEELDGIRIRGVPERKEKEARLCHNYDPAEVQKGLDNLEVNTVIGDIPCLRRYEEHKTKAVILKVPKDYR